MVFAAGMISRRFHLHTSNKSEELARRMVEIMQRDPLENPLRPENIMVQNTGAARWLSTQIAATQGIAFNLEFPFPNKIFSTIAQAIEPKYESEGQYDVTRAAWILYELLDQIPDSKNYQLLRDYCSGSPPIKRYQLALRLASLFDRYLIYRPSMIIDWERGGALNWQGRLWNLLKSRLYPQSEKPPHSARLWHRLHHDQSKKHRNKAYSIDRLFVFGISTLAPLHLDFLYNFSARNPVHIFLLQPTDLYWGDLQTQAQARRASQRRRVSKTSNQNDTDGFLPLQFDSGNPILPLLGKQSQEFLDALIDLDPEHDDSRFQAPTEESLLACIQRDMLELANRTSPLDSSHIAPFPHPDSSLQFHSCHNKRRECESLKDFVLFCLNETPELRLSDFMIMAPDIQEYAATIEAVFSDAETPEQSLSFSIADQSSLSNSPVASALAAAFELPLKRITSEEIGDFIELPSIVERFSFSERERAMIRYWIREYRITWGWDAKHRASLGGFPTDRSTWSELCRILGSGIALAVTEEAELYHDHLICNDLEGDFADLAGRFLELAELVESLIEESNRPRGLDEWTRFFSSHVASLIRDCEENSRQIQFFIEALQASLDTTPLVVNETIPYEIAFDAIKRSIEQQTPRSGYLNGSITFCSLKPMRSIPSKIICLLGMNLDSFPRKGEQTQFDLIKQHPQRGDRNPRDEDKEIFLESVLSAREKLYISYIGQADTGDEALPPSTIVSSIIDYLEASYRNENVPAETMASLIRIHKRHRFDPSYFQSGNYYTFSQEAASAANEFQNRFGKRSQPELPKVEYHQLQNPEADEPIELESLLAFFKEPCRFFLAHSCQLRFPFEEDSFQTEDLLSASGLDRYKRNDFLLNQDNENIEPDQLRRFFDAKRWTAPAYFGEFESAHSLRQMESMIAALAPVGSIHSDCSTRFRLEVSGRQIVGNLPINGSGWIVDAKPSDNKPHRVLSSWISHLFACCHPPDSKSRFRGTIVAGIDYRTGDPSFVRFDCLSKETAEERLESIMSVFEYGLQTPLLIYPELSHAFAKARNQQRTEKGEADEGQLLQTLQRQLAASTSSFAPAQSISFDQSIKLCFGDAPILGTDFAERSIEIWQPLLESSHLQKGQIDL